MRPLAVFPCILLAITAAQVQLAPAMKKQNAWDAVANSVTIYEDANYGGTGKIFEPGAYFLSGFEDVASSIEVPPGMAVMLYEYGTSRSGTGYYVDLMENCPDLSVYHFNDITSYIVVFKTSKPNGFVWSRNKIRNGKFVAGHWERKKASGVLPDNAPPALRSPTPVWTGGKVGE